MKEADGGAWRARARAAVLMYGSGACIGMLSLLPAQPPTVNRAGIFALSLLALVGAGGIRLLGRRYTMAVSHLTSFAGSVLVAAAIHMAGGSYLTFLFAMMYIWIVLFSVFFQGLRGAVAQTTISSVAGAVGLSGLPLAQGALTWALTTTTLYILVACYHWMARHSTRLRGLVEHSGGVVTIVNRDLTIVYQSPLVERVFGYQTDELAHGSLLELIHPDDREQVLTVLTEAAQAPGSFTTLDFRLRHQDGSWRHTETSVENLLADDSIEGIVLSIRDVSDRKLLQDQLAHQAFHDPLTGLANRALLTNRLEHALARLDRSDTQIAVLLLDIDDFKSVNDSMGHGSGDALLGAIASRLRQNIRAMDTVARLGGDEFAVLLEDCREDYEPSKVAQRLLDALAVPVVIDETEVFVTTSIGVAVTSDGSGLGEDLLRDADAAMYLAKRRGKGRFERFEPGMHEKLLRRLQLKSDLRRAIERGELRVVYQPTVSLATGRVYGMEALIRWQHPTLGMVSPMEFIPLAEESGLILDIGQWILLEACKQLRRWRDQHRDWPQLRMSVNVSGRQLESDLFVDTVQAALRQSGVEPGQLVLEITESVLLADVEATAKRLQRLKELGIVLAIDDFGTGYSSLSYLNKLPVDLIKIDKSFVDDVTEGTDNAALVDAVVQLGRSLGLNSLAEGIEHQTQAEQLRELACEYGQGYLFARPLSAEEVHEWLGENIGASAASHSAA